MANDNPSRDTASRQQTADRSQTGSGQQGSTPQGSHSQSAFGQGGGGQGGQGTYGQGTGQGGQGTYGQGAQGQGGQASQGPMSSGTQGTSTWQGGRSAQSGMPSRRGSASMSPYSQGYESGYGSGPFSLMRRISDEMDRFFENFGMGRSAFPSQQQGSGQEAYGGGPGLSSMWSPHIEVSERNGKLLIEADLPGIKRDDINVRIEQDAVIIQGQRQQQQSSNERGYYRSERSYGSFYRTIPLPEGVDAESASATFRDGVLEIEFDAPRQRERGRTLEIRDGGSGSAAHGTAASYAGTGSGSTYGSGTTGSMQGSTTGASQHAASASGGSQQTSGAGSSQHASPSGTTYSGSGNPSAGATATSSSAGSTDRSRGSRET